MHNLTRKILPFTISVLASLPAFADEDETGGVGIGLRAGMQGLGLELSFAVTESVNVRGGYYYFEYDDEVEDTDVVYDATLDLSNISLLLDWHPGSAGFRVTAGLVSYTDGSLSGSAEPDSGLTYTINDQVYLADDITDLRADIEFGGTAPYIGIGWGNATGPGKWGFVFDLGVIKLGGADVSVAFQCRDSIATDCAQLENDVQAEIDELESDAEDFDWWPVVNLGVAYRF